jgi:predicted Fe-S protein YdhL (DUF1289 family)
MGVCVSICKYDKDKICVGCFRKKSEISKWKKMSKKEKRKVKDKIKKRRQKIRGEDYYGNPI